MNNVAQVLNYQGNYYEAENVHREVLGLQKVVLGPEHPHTLTSMNNVASTLSRHGNYYKAELRSIQALFWIGILE